MKDNVNDILNNKIRLTLLHIENQAKSKRVKTLVVPLKEIKEALRIPLESITQECSMNLTALCEEMIVIQRHQGSMTDY